MPINIQNKNSIIKSIQSVSYKSKCIAVFLTIFKFFNLCIISFPVNTPPTGKYIYLFDLFRISFSILVDFPTPEMSEVKIVILSKLSIFIFSKF